MKLSSTLKKKRAEYGLTQADLATRVKVSKPMMCDIEKGMKIPSVSLLIRIADVFHCSLDELIGRKVG